MKIIAKSGNRSYIVEATSQEIDFLAGKSICGGKFGEEKDPNYILGTQFNIIQAFDQIHRNDKRKEEIERVRQALTFALNGLDMVGPLIEEPKPEEKETEIQA